MSGKRIVPLQWVLAVCLMAGVLLSPPARAQPATVGEWSGMLSWPASATHAHLLRTGKVMFVGEFDEGTDAWLWDPLSEGRPTKLSPPGYNVFCAGHSFLADGRMLWSGGHVASHMGLSDASIFDPISLRWTRLPDMKGKRWYPTNTTLADGNVLVTSGEVDGSEDLNELPEVFLPSKGTWKPLPTAESLLPYYPRMFLTEYGKVFFAGPAQQTRLFDTNGTGVSFHGALSNFGSRTYGPAVYLDGKVLLIGGGDPPTDTVEQADTHELNPTWRYVAPMTSRRRQHNATLLPDGTVLVTGGSSAKGFDTAGAPVFHAEVYNPATNTWTRLASQKRYRGYHSTALLLPDGRVLSAGGRREHSAEIFSPPYLFKGPRPTVKSAPEMVVPGTTFFVETPDAAAVTKVTLLAPGSVTHAFDEHQRLLTLRFTQTAGGLTLQAPASNNLAPPGYYQLFLVNSAGVPSVGRWVRIGSEPTARTRVLSFSDVWKYDDTGKDLGTAWRALDYDDSDWDSGPGQIGYGEGDEATVVRKALASQPTVYFRKKFTLDRLPARAELELLHDDGVAVWLNGELVFSKHVDNGLEFSRRASFTNDNEYSRATLTAERFRAGANILAVAVKQVGGTSTDLSFALGLEVFSGAGPTPDKLTVLAPNGAEVLTVGTSTALRWASTGAVGTVDLDYSLDRGATWVSIATAVPNTGTYSWTVPGAVSAAALVRVSQSGGGGGLSDVSDAPFSIARPTSDKLTVLAPNGGEALVVGTSASLRWASTDAITAVDIDYSKDRGVTWVSIATAVPNTGIYSWTVPDVVTAAALVRVSQAGGGGLSDVSDAPFSVTRSTGAEGIAFGEVWKYHDSGVNPGATWNTLGYDDSAWRSGPGQLGYGEKDEATVLKRTFPSQTSVYFRKKLVLSGPVTTAALRVRFDDGIAVWVNGTLVLTRNMGSGLLHERYASAAGDNTEHVTSIPAAPFVAGENVIGVMVKQVGKKSPDISFDLELKLTR